MIEVLEDSVDVLEIIREKDIQPDHKVMLLSELAPSVIHVLEDGDRENKGFGEGPKPSVVSMVHDDILALIFEIGASGELAGPHCTFATTVSHVTRRWRNMALTTPRLWTRTWCSKSLHDDDDASDVYDDYDDYGDPIRGPYSEGEIDRFSTFLSRSMSMPVEIHLQYFHSSDFAGDKGAALSQLIVSHIGHCSHLHITGGEAWGMQKLIHLISDKSAPLMSSIQLGVDLQYGMADYAECIAALPALSCAPNINSVQLRGDEEYLPFLSSMTSLRHITALQFHGIYTDDLLERSSFQKTLLEMEALDYLEMAVDWHGPQFNPPLMLPTIRSLKILHGSINHIHAPLVTTLSLDERPMMQMHSGMEAALLTRFPSLKHLILTSLSLKIPRLDTIARSFPGIERLTCCFDCPSTQKGPQFDIGLIFTVIIGASAIPGTLCWPKLRTLAVSALSERISLHSRKVYNGISMVQEAGHPISKLMLPRIGSCGMPHVPGMPEANEKAMAELRKIIEVGEFSTDWPEPFVRSSFDTSLEWYVSK